MVEIGVRIADGRLVHGLMRQLRGLFPSSAVTYDATHQQVCVRSEWESRAVIAVIDSVQTWIDESGSGTAVLTVGGRTYQVVGPNPGGT